MYAKDIVELFRYELWKWGVHRFTVYPETPVKEEGCYLERLICCKLIVSTCSLG